MIYTRSLRLLILCATLATATHSLDLFTGLSYSGLYYHGAGSAFPAPDYNFISVFAGAPLVEGQVDLSLKIGVDGNRFHQTANWDVISTSYFMYNNGFVGRTRTEDFQHARRYNAMIAMPVDYHRGPWLFRLAGAVTAYYTTGTSCRQTITWHNEPLLGAWLPEDTTGSLTPRPFSSVEYYDFVGYGAGYEWKGLRVLIEGRLLSSIGVTVEGRLKWKVL